MPTMPPRIFLIGPGGVGKTSAGRELAALLGYAFVDLDQAFCDQIAPIDAFLRAKGYERYIEANAALFDTLCRRHGDDVVMPLSSGFLATHIRPDLVERNRQAVRCSGVSVLLLPSLDAGEAAEIIVERQLQRGFGLQRHSEFEKFHARFPAYLGLGDLRVVSTQPPAEIAAEIVTLLQGR
jgi:shikimate kinase